MRDSLKQPGQAGTFLRIGGRCYAAANNSGGSHVKRVNLLEYFELAEALHAAKQSLRVEKIKGGAIWIATYELPAKLNVFIKDDNGFSTSKRAAKELADEVRVWTSRNLMNDGGKFSSEKLDEDFSDWQLSTITGNIDSFKNVSAAECGEVDVYSVGQISIYKTSALVSDGAGIIPVDIQSDMPVETLIEFNSAGRCLAFDLPTACGFHALRGLELVMDDYLRSFGVTSKMRSWNDYIKALDKLAQNPKPGSKPAPKVAAMLDRMRELERNPLMHPRDTLDAVQADMLFKLCAITVIEIAKDIKAKKEATAGLALPANDASLASLYLVPEAAAS